MSSVDDRIVNMQFNNKQFTQGVTQSQKSLNGLEQSLQKTAKSQGLASLDQQVGGLRGKFSAMQVAGVSAVATIASKATAAGLNFVKSFTLDPITQGFQEYQTNLNSIQTVMSNTGLVGQKGMKKVNTALDELNHYSDLTIYNFSEMARNVGTFTAAGVKLKPAVSAIKGIANLAALSGSSSLQASTAMYQLSQAIAAGRVNLQDWNSVVNAGMGGKQFQTALARTAVAMGKIDQKSVQVGDTVRVMGKSFRESIGGQGPHWLDSKILVATLDTLDGRFSKAAMRLETNKDGTRKYTDAQIEARIQTNRLALAKKEDIKFTDKQFAAVRKQADAAATAATQVKSLPQLVGVVRESMGSIWSTFFRGVLGTYTQSVNLWTKVGDVVQKGTNALNNNIIGMVTTWADSGRRLLFINALGTVFKSLGAIMGAMKGAFDEVFPVHGGQTLIKLTDGFVALVNALVPSKKTVADLRDIFGGVFAVLHIGVSIISAIAAGFKAFFGEVFKGSGDAGSSILDFAAHIGDLLKNLDKFLTSGGKMTDLFKGFGKYAGVAVGQFIQIGTNIVQGLIKGIEGGALGSLKGAVAKLAQFIPDQIKSILGIHSPAQTMIPIGQNIIQGIIVGIDMAMNFIGQSLGRIGDAIFGGIRDEFKNMNALDLASVINALFSGALILTARNLLGNFKQIGKSISGAFGQLTNTLKSMQREVQSKIIKNIAIAVALLAASLIALSLVNPAKLAMSLGAIAALTGILVAAMKSMGSIGQITDSEGNKIQKGSMQLLGLSVAMIGMATAMAILSGAVVLLGLQKPETLAKGLGAVAIMMGLMVGSLVTLSKVGPLADGAAGSILIMSLAMNALTVAVIALGMMNVKTLAKGLGAVAIGLGLMVGALVILGNNLGSTVVAAGAILTMAGAMVVLATAVFAFGHMKFETLAKGFGAVAVGLGLFVGALLILGANIGGTIVAAGAMLTMAAAMAMLVPVILTFGNMDMGTLAKGLGVVAVALTLFVVAVAALGAVAMVVGPGLLMLGGALALIGLGMAAFGTGFALLAATGTAGIAVMTAAITAFIMLLPNIAIQMAAALVVFLEAIAAAAPRIRAAFGVIFTQILGVVMDAMPQIGLLISALITMIIDIFNRAIPQIASVFRNIISAAIGVLRHSASQWIDSAIFIINKFLTAIDDHLDGFIDKGTDIIVKLIEGFGRSASRIATAVAETIFKFLNILDAQIIYWSPKIAEKGKDIAKHLVEGFATGIIGADNVAKVKSAVGALVNIAKVAFTGPAGFIIKSPSRVTREYGQRVGEGLALGINDSTPQAGRSARTMGHHVAQSLASGISDGVGIAVRAAVGMANAVLAAGDQQAQAAYGNASNLQKNADAAQARADLARQDAARFKGKAAKSKAAKAAKKAADRAQNAADAAQAQADAAAQSASDLKDFNAADLQTKGDKRNEAAVALAEQAQKRLEKANAETAKAIAIGKKNRAAAAKLRAAAQADAQAAASLAAQAQQAHQDALNYYGQNVMDRVNAIADARAAEKKAAEDQVAYEAADTQGKIDILNQRIAEQQAIADKRNADAAALLEKARGEAYSNAAQAMADLDASEKAAQDAKDAADAAQQTKDQLAQLVGGGDSPSIGGGSGGGGTIQPSRSVLEDAASAMDRYTASLVQAEELMAAQQPVIQFEQNNYSPESLSASEIYRQTHNLLSTKNLP